MIQFRIVKKNIFSTASVEVAMPNLEVLSISYCTNKIWITAPALKTMTAHELNVGYSNYYSLALSKSVHLENFHCGDFLTSTDLSFYHSMANLKTFSIYVIGYRFDIIEIVLKSFKNLKKGKIVFDTNRMHLNFDRAEHFRKIEDVCLRTNFDYCLDENDRVVFKKGDTELTIIDWKEMNEYELELF